MKKPCSFVERSIWNVDFKIWFSTCHEKKIFKFKFVLVVRSSSCSVFGMIEWCGVANHQTFIFPRKSNGSQIIIRLFKFSLSRTIINKAFSSSRLFICLSCCVSSIPIYIYNEIISFLNFIFNTYTKIWKLI